MKINLEFTTFEEMEAFARQILGNPNRTQAAAPAPMPQMTSAAATTGPVPAPAAPVPAPAAPAPVKAVSRQEVQTKAIALMDAGKQGQLQALLMKYNVPALPSIPEDQLAAFMADLEVL